MRNEDAVFEEVAARFDKDARKYRKTLLGVARRVAEKLYDGSREEFEKRGADDPFVKEIARHLRSTGIYSRRECDVRGLLAIHFQEPDLGLPEEDALGLSIDARFELLRVTEPAEKSGVGPPHSRRTQDRPRPCPPLG
ncbi:MAG: hypothetical protein M5R36_02155 [Deltaproteobacteria bacterium]|nr:hypothetical protein [Deltaproteobacteria bacterium]